MNVRSSLLLLLVALASCGDGAVSGPPPNAPPTTASSAMAPATPAPTMSEKPPPAPASTTVTRPGKTLTIAEARRYMLDLINRDRRSQGLPPVELDEGPAQKAAQAHAEDMAKLGYLGHWSSDGSVPEQRMSDAGGLDMILENALCFTDEKPRTLDPKPPIDPKAMEKSESQFFDEVPPNDGHRKNILRPHHVKVGIGIAQPISTAAEIGVPCVAQEFVDAYGTYTALPRKAKIGATVRVEGTLSNGARPSGVGVARAPLPKPISTNELNKRRSYPVPKPYQMYWPPGFVTPIPLKVDGTKFSIDVPLSDGGQPGLYEVSIWAKIGPSNENVIVGMQTIRVE